MIYNAKSTMSNLPNCAKKSWENSLKHAIKIKMAHCIFADDTGKISVKIKMNDKNHRKSTA